MPPETIRYPWRMTESTDSADFSDYTPTHVFRRAGPAEGAFTPQFAQLLLYCRPGFEKECAAEISDVTAGLGVAGYCRAKPDSGYVLFVPADTADLRTLRRDLRFADLTFPRQLLFAGEIITDLPVMDRAGPLTAAASVLAPRFSDVLLETADTNEAKELSSFLRKFDTPFAKALAAAGLVGDKRPQAKPRASTGSSEGAPGTPRQEPISEGLPLKFNADAPPPLPRPEGAGLRGARLHVFFLSSSAAICAVSDAGNRSDWPLGIPRLRMPREAPSRSTLKLAEAFLAFDLEAQLRTGQTAVDLGAAPGGWTYQLVRRGIHVTAVDNGPMDKSLLGYEMVEHLREDGLKYRPKRPVDWLVCDMVESPARIARVMADWLAEGKAAAAIFNLKLPMKRRYDELETCRALIETRLEEAGLEYSLAFKQLYHDREEVTAYLRAQAPAGGIRPAPRRPQPGTAARPTRGERETKDIRESDDFGAFSVAAPAAKPSKSGKSAKPGKTGAAPRPGKPGGARSYFSDADSNAFGELGEFSSFTPGQERGPRRERPAAKPAGNPAGKSNAKAAPRGAFAPAPGKPARPGKGPGKSATAPRGNGGKGGKSATSTAGKPSRPGKAASAPRGGGKARPAPSRAAPRRKG